MAIVKLKKEFIERMLIFQYYLSETKIKFEFGNRKIYYLFIYTD